MSQLLVLLSVVIYIPSNAEIFDSKQRSAASENQFDVSPQSIPMDSIGQVAENSDIFMSAAGMNGDIYRNPLTTYRSPGYQMISPYYGNIPYPNRFNLPYNRLGYVPFNRLPFAGQVGMYPRFNQYPWRSGYASMPTDSDLQFSYLMTHPQAAMTYQNLAYN